MEVKNFPYVDVAGDAVELAAKAERWLFAQIERTRARSLFIPAGRTPLPLYERWEKTRPGILDGLALCPVDEVVTGAGAGMFARFLAETLPSYAAAIRPVREDLAEIPCVALLGLGLNGHVAFHEPHVSADFTKGIVDLESRTCAELGLEAPVRGLTYGVGTFRQCAGVAIIVSNERKRTVLQRLLHSDEPMPARWLMDSFVHDPKRAHGFRLFVEERLLR